MKKLSLLLVLVSAFAFSQAKKVVSSEVNWWGYKVAKTEASSHTGTVKVKNGVVVLKKGKIAGGNFVLDMTSINATDLQGEYQQKLNGHLKNGDFFEVDKFPVAAYKISSVTKSGKEDFPYVVKGNLTVKGKTNAVSFPAKISVKNGVVTLSSDKFSFDRQKFDIAYQSSMKDVLIKDEVEMQITFTAK